MKKTVFLSRAPRFSLHATISRDYAVPMASSMFPDPRRIVTGHSPDGKAIVVADSTIPCVPILGKANFAVLYETHRFPESNDEWVDPTKSRTTDLSNDQGVILRVVDFAPNTETVSLQSIRVSKVSSHVTVF
jgi:hypothetical protein